MSGITKSRYSRTRIVCSVLLVSLTGLLFFCDYYYVHWSAIITSSFTTLSTNWQESENAMFSLDLQDTRPDRETEDDDEGLSLLEQTTQFQTTEVTLAPKTEKKRRLENRSPRSQTGYTLKDWKKHMLKIRLTDDYTYCPRILPLEGPFDFIGESQNPCWWDKTVLRCLPYFFLAGFSKSGTTDLFFRITQHPLVVNGRKEVHWFDYRRFLPDSGSVQNYTNMFDIPAKAIKTDLQTSGDSKIITGDGTPCVAWFSLYWRCYQGNQGREEPRYTNADVIYRMNPKTKIIFLFREPVARLYSRFLTWIHRAPGKAYQKPSPQSFHDTVAKAVLKYKQCFKQWSPRHCAYNGTLYTEAMLRLQEGMYSVFVKDWLKVFPREQLLFIRFEDYIKDERNTVQRVLSFLELPPVKDQTLERIMKVKPKNKGSHYRDMGPMLNKTKALAEDFYRPFVLELAKLLEDKKYLWHYK